MEKEKTATEQLSQILDETGYNYITPYGFKLLRENEMVTNQKQAKIGSVGKRHMLSSICRW